MPRPSTPASRSATAASRARPARASTARCATPRSIAARPGAGLLLSGEDLTCQAGLAVQQDSLLAASLGIGHVERNGHHYVDGFGVAPDAEARDVRRTPIPASTPRKDGPPRLAVRAGRLDLRDLHGPGFASAAHPRWDSLQPIH